MRILFTFMCVLALGIMGCSETSGTGGSGGSAGDGGMGGDGGTGGMPECRDPEDCDDREECTTDACVSGICENMAVEDGTVCDESNECTEDGVCADGTCDSVPVPDGTGCDENPMGGFNGLCLAGECKGFCETAEDCDDLDDCTDDACIPVGDGTVCANVLVEDGTPCAGGACEAGACELSGTLLPCSEQGIRNAIAAGGGPYTFDCGGPKTVVTQEEIGIDNDVILDGEGNLTVDGDRSHAVFLVDEGSVVEFHAIAITGAGDREERGIHNSGTLTLSNSTLFGNGGGGIQNHGTLTMTSVTISDNVCVTWCDGAGIFNYGALTVMNTTISGNSALGGGGGIMNAGSGTADIINSTVSGNTASAEGGGTSNEGVLTMTNCTISENTSDESKGSVSNVGTMMLSATLIDGDCRGTLTSNGYNIESPGDTCGFDHGTDLVNITEGQLDLGDLANNGGPTMTHALDEGSVAIDHIPAVDCEVAEDQRGQPRPETGGTMCDVGAFEVQP